MQNPLAVCKRNLQSVGMPHTEILNILSAGAVYHAGKAVKTFNVRNQLHPLLARDCRLSQHLPDRLVPGVIPDNVAAPLCIAGIFQCQESLPLPAVLGQPCDMSGFVDVWVGPTHELKCSRIGHYIRPQQIQKRIKVVVPCLHRRGCEQHHSICVAAEKFHARIGKGAAIPDVVRLIHDDQVELRRRVKVKKTIIFLSVLGRHPVQGRSCKDGVGHNGLSVSIRPHAIPVGIGDCPTQVFAVHLGKCLVKAFHLQLPLPLRYQRLGADDQDGFRTRSGLKLLHNQACFNCLADTDAVGNQQSGLFGLNHLECRPELIGYKVNAG